MPTLTNRAVGVLMPVSSLPGPYGIGCFGREAYRFVDFLAQAGQTVWQVLPLGPTGYGDSPYQSCSAFAGNPYFIDLDRLVNEGLLTHDLIGRTDFGADPSRVDYAALYNGRFARLRDPLFGRILPLRLFERQLAGGLLPVHGRQRGEPHGPLAGVAQARAHPPARGSGRPEGAGRR